MAHGAAVAIGLGLVINRRRRKQNAFRQGYITEEDDYLALRLKRHEVHEIALEYVRWRQQVHGVKMAYYTSLKRIKVFLHYIARGGYYHQLGRAEGIAMTTTMGYLHDVSAFMQQTSAKYVTFVIN
jgi:hypothetical protein